MGSAVGAAVRSDVGGQVASGSGRNSWDAMSGILQGSTARLRISRGLIRNTDSLATVRDEFKATPVRSPHHRQRNIAEAAQSFSLEALLPHPVRFSVALLTHIG